MIDHAAQFEQAQANGWHAYGVVLLGKGAHAGGKATAYVYARNEAEARAKAVEHSDPDEEEAGDAFLQRGKELLDSDGCPCLVCQWGEALPDA